MATQEQVIEKVEQNAKKLEDFWGKHNVGTRFAFVVITLIYAVVMIHYMFVTPKISDTVYKTIIEYSSYTLVFVYAVIALGINGLKVLLDGLAKIKNGGGLTS